MHRLTPLSVLLITLLAAALPARLSAQPVITGLPTGKSAYLGSSNANVTFDVVAFSADAGNLTYQWGTAGGNSFTPISDNTTYNGTTTATLTVNNTDTSLNGTKYKCQITEGANTVSTFGVPLSVFSAPTEVPTVSVTGTGTSGSNPAIASNSTANVTIVIGNLTSGEQVRVQRFLDINSNGKGDTGELLVQNFFVTDGQVTKFGGITDPILAGDDDHTQDGNITTHFPLSSSAEMGRLSGNYVIKISSPTGKFLPITKPLTVTQPNYGPSVSGQVKTGSTPVPFAPVGILQQDNSGDTQFITGTVADASGNFTLNAPLGNSYSLMAFVPGYVGAFSAQPSFNLTNNTPLTAQNPALVRATCMIAGKVQDSVTPSNTIPSVQFFVQGQNTGSVLIANSDSNGDFVAPVTADAWQADISDNSLPPLGYLRSQSKLNADTTGGINVNATVTMEAVNAMIYGQITNGSNPLAGVLLDVSDNGNYETNAATDSNGFYYAGVNGASSPGTYWNVSADNQNPALVGLVPFSSNSYQIIANTAQLANFTTATVTANLVGTAKLVNLDGSVVGNVGNLTVQANLQNTNSNVQVQSTTDSNGNFTLGVFAGAWNIQLNYQTGNSQGIATGNINGNSTGNLVGESVNEVVTDGHDVTGIPYLVLNATNNITGNVVDGNNQPFSNNNVFGTATINGNIFSINTQTDNGGHYTLPIVNGNNTVPITWNISANNGGGSIYYDQLLVTNSTNASSNITANFSPSPYLIWVNSHFNSGQQIDPSYSGVGAIPGIDGIPNLVKFAFGLSPFVTSQSSLPHATIVNGKLTLVFSAANTDVTYTVQASTDLTNWSTTGVTQSSPDVNQMVTATYDLTGHPTAFLRILITLIH